MLNSNITDIYSHKYMKIKINLDDNLPFKKTLAMHNIVILVISVSNINHNRYYHHKFLEKCFFK